MENFEENLVGPRSHEREESIDLLEDVAISGEPLWMAFLDNPEALSISKEEVQAAKNALIEMQNQQPEVIKMCTHKSIEECKDMIQLVGSNNIAA